MGRYRAIASLLWAILCLGISLPGAGQKIAFRGKIVDFDDGRPLPGVVVAVPSIKKQTISDSLGRFQISLDVDTYILEFSSLTHRTMSRIVYLFDENDITVAMYHKLPSELPEVLVEAKARDANVADPKMSVINLIPASLRKTPLVLGEVDILKALALQAGVTTVGEGSGGIYVRGGSADQNLVLLDGAPLYNTSHLLGFYSSLNAESISDVTLYKGTFPASMGGRLSSVVAMKMKPGNPTDLHYAFGAGPLSAHASIEGPIVKNKLTFDLTARVAYPKPLMNQIEGSVASSDAFFYDFSGKLQYRAGKYNTISISLYRSYDNYKFSGDTSFKWRTNIASLNWRSSLSKKFFLNVNANYSYYNSDVDGLQDHYQYRLRNFINSKEAKASLTWKASDQNEWEVGGGYVYYALSPGVIGPTSGNSSINPQNLREEYGGEFSAFLIDRWDFMKIFSLEAGLRLSQYQYLGPNTVYSYLPGQPPSGSTLLDSTSYRKGQVIHTYFGWEPRLLLKIALGEETSLKLSYNRNRQYLQLVSNTVAITPVDYWKLSDPMIKPAYSDQYAVGLFRNFHDNLFETSVEGFYKVSKIITDYRNGANLVLNRYIDADLLPANGKAYGIEANLRKTKGKYYGQFAFTWSRSWIQDITPYAQQQVNGGTYYPSIYDRPINISLTGGIQLEKGWTFGFIFQYLTGRPATYPDGTYVFNNMVVTNYSARNLDRVPDYHRLDISFTHDSRRFPEQKKYTIVNISIYNVYARKNPYSVFFQQSANVLNSYELTVLGTIVPSITLNFYF